MGIIVSLKAVNNSAKTIEAKRIRKELFASCRRAVDQLGEEIAGYALVTWGKDGELRSAYDAQNGPIRATLVPMLVHDALNRHVAVMLSADYIREREGETE